MQPGRKVHRRRGRLGVRLAGITVLLTTAAVIGTGSQAGASPASPQRFKPAPAGSVVNHLPLGMTNTPVTVMLQMAGDPVTVADANAATPLTSSQRASHKAQLRTA